MSNEDCRRKGDDRRNVDAGPPAGWRERRRTVERRLPQVEELELSEEEFLQLLFTRSLDDADDMDLAPAVA